MRYLLDTNIMIAAMKEVASVKRQLEQRLLADLLLSPVVLGELEFGVEKSAYREQNAGRLAKLVDTLALVPIDARVSRRYGEIRAHLERCGTPIGANDLWIAAQGLALDVIVVTDNQNEFNRVPGLRTENWLNRS
ncbi:MULTISPECIES: PIN domain-containing protein [Thiorhodovibrio]|uniref:PIN domain-containing protein n=1 Tax=Thiorhodovibrio TaxID=61593 RepID=UPI001912E9BA|nr:PIN domain-containing protein [Thiorhodovibrio litoralis]MBK5968309.1 VapC toxin family PIN domain ribonuclease [Thiorhodovibrio winogradskyi]WPL15018.1 tRNA(fMet)-specific endonuclease VapC [Thiorhodovibrio litoralis]